MDEPLVSKFYCLKRILLETSTLQTSSKLKSQSQSSKFSRNSYCPKPIVKTSECMCLNFFWLYVFGFINFVPYKSSIYLSPWLQTLLFTLQMHIHIMKYKIEENFRSFFFNFGMNEHWTCNVECRNIKKIYGNEYRAI